jgi:predicted nucleotide-binding protein (sugar kinase/HSP70/actin superfamily)
MFVPNLPSVRRRPERTMTSQQYKRPLENPFLEEHREDTTVLFGTLTPKHETFIRAVFRGAGYKCENLPPPTRRMHDTGKEFCNNGLCNPNYFTAGALIEYLRERVQGGITPEQAVRKYVYFTAGGCGPCRYGMYEGEYKQALDNAGFKGFRVITFQSGRAIQEGSQQPGLRFTVNFGVGMFNALNLGDALFDLTYQIRPYEVHPGETDRVMAECVEDAARFLETRRHFELLERVPWWMVRTLLWAPAVKNWASIATKVREHLYGTDYLKLLDSIRERLDGIEVDRTRVKPVVKITGEFFSALTEGDTNYNLFSFLEQEGAEVWVESIVSLIQYWLYQAELHNGQRRGLKSATEFWKKDLLLRFCISFWSRQYDRIRHAFGDLAHPLPAQTELAELAGPWYDPLARGGEGHLEVGKGLYYSRHRKCHMVLSVKPFGCLPSTQSDGVMAAVCAQNPGLLFLPLETSAEGEVHALSRVQMALGDARRQARTEFHRILEEGGIELSQIRDYVAQNRALRRPFYSWPPQPGIAGTAASYVAAIAAQVRKEYGC